MFMESCFSFCCFFFCYVVQFSSVAQSCLTLWPHGPQHARPPCLSPTPGVYPKLMSTESVMPFNHLILCHPLLLPSSIFPSIRESVLPIRWPKYWSFSFSTSPSNEYSGLFLLGWTASISLQSKGLPSPTPQFKSINSSALSLLYGPTLTFIHNYWKKHSFD